MSNTRLTNRFNSLTVKEYFASPMSKLVLGLALFCCVTVVYSCNQSEQEASAGISSAVHQGFVGDAACQSCHPGPSAAWQGSHHDYAMLPAGEASVRGDFNETEFTHNGETFRFFRQDSLYMVEATGPDGSPVQYRVTYTFGWEPLQQYLIDYGRGKLQALNIAWDTERERWFVLNPDEDLEHGDWLHWTGQSMNWNSMCADCHSTNLRQNYIASADSFQTTWSSINVSCEACHGPGNDHVAFMQSDASAQATIERIRQDLGLTGNSNQVQQVTQCAQCHSLREELNTSYDHTGNFLDHFSPGLPHPPEYFADGQIRGEVYVYGSFLQSKMYANGVMCSDCHDPHSLELKADVTDNSLCMSCHVPSYNTWEHTFHELNTEASQCISCHMPGRYYMEVDFRRDHSFRVPRPDLTVQFGTPNACNSCHESESAEWAAEAVEQWHGPPQAGHYSELLARVDSLGLDVLPDLRTGAVDTTHPDMARATMAWYLGQFPSPQNAELLAEMLFEESPLIRNSAARALAGFPEELKSVVLQDALDDSVLAVRIAAAGGLAEVPLTDISFGLRQAFNEAIVEYEQYLEANSYFPQGQMNMGQYYEKRGRPEQAIQAYRQALLIDPEFNPARINLAYIYNRQGRNAEAEQLLRDLLEQESEFGQGHYSLALLLAEEDRLPEALTYFERASELLPGDARVHYNRAIGLQTLGRVGEAEEAYLEAIDLAPDQPDYRYGISTLYIQQNDFQSALPHAERLLELQPGNPQAQNLMNLIRREVD